MKGDRKALMITVVARERDEMVAGTGADGKGDMGKIAGERAGVGRVKGKSEGLWGQWLV